MHTPILKDLSCFLKCLQVFWSFEKKTISGQIKAQSYKLQFYRIKWHLYTQKLLSTHGIKSKKRMYCLPYYIKLEAVRWSCVEDACLRLKEVFLRALGGR